MATRTVSVVDGGNEERNGIYELIYFDLLIVDN